MCRFSLNWKRIGMGIGICFVVTFGLLAGFATMMEKEIVSLEWADYLAAISLLAGTILCTLGTGEGRRGWTELLVMEMIWVTLLFVLNAILYECRLNGVIPVLAITSGGMVAGVLLKPHKNRKYRGRRKHRYR